MSTFSRLLNSLVHQKDIAVYPMTQYCGIDRTLMYKYLNGKDYPREQAIVDRMADFMRLSPSESEELRTAWQPDIEAGYGSELRHGIYKACGCYF